MAPNSPPMSISPDGQEFVISSLDGQLSLWDTNTGEMTGQYTPSAHLSATCVCLSWPPTPRTSLIQSKKLKNSHKKQKVEPSGDLQNLIDKLGLLAMGTEDGTVLLYSCKQNRLYHELKKDGHTGRVNDIAWSITSDSLFTAGDDKFVIEWRITGKGVECKHQLDRQPINALAVLDVQNLLTASNSIKWWHWPTKQLLKTFNGHSTEVCSLRPIFFDDCDLPVLPAFAKGELNGNGKAMVNGDKLHENEDDQCSFYFLSSAKSDRYICAWDLNSTHSNSVANFSMDEEAVSIQLAYTSSTKVAYILAISRRGTLYVFEHLFGESHYAKATKLNGSVAALAIVPRMHIEIQLQQKKAKNKNNKAMELPFLAASMASDELASEVVDRDLVTVVVAYGLQERPTFETFSYEQLAKINDEQAGRLVLDNSEQIMGRTKPKLVEKTSHQKIQRMPVGKAEEKTTVIGPTSLMPGMMLFNGTMTNSSMDPEEDMEIVNGGDDNNNISSKTLANKKRKLSESEKMARGNEEEEEMKSKNENENEMTFEEKLRHIETKMAEAGGSSSSSTKKSSVIPRVLESGSSAAATDSLVTVLVQGLQSDDRKMLDTVLLDTKEENVMLNTARKLPVEMVTSLLRELQKGLYRPGKHHMRYLKWIGLLIKAKISYLMTLPNLDKEFLSLNQLLQSRTVILERCYQLKGKLDIILEQAQASQKHEMLIYQKPEVTYESESSSEEEDEVDDGDEEEEGDDDDDNAYEDDKLINYFDPIMDQDGDDREEEDDDDDDDDEVEEDNDEDEDDEGETSDRADDLNLC